MNQLDLLTSEAQYMLATMYKEYLDRRAKSQNRDDAMYFDDVYSIHESLMPEWSYEDVLSVCFELKQLELINASAADSGLFRISISTFGVAIMEYKFKNRVNETIEFIAKIKSLIPFI